MSSQDPMSVQCTLQLFKGEVCGKWFKRSGDLRRHVNNTHKKQKPYACDSCGKRFAQRSGLMTHENTHTGKRPYVCDHCDASFADGSSCTRHRKEVHLSTGPYKCNVSGCGRSVKRRGVFVTHLRKFHPEMDFTQEDVDLMAPTPLPRIPAHGKKASATHHRVRSGTSSKGTKGTLSQETEGAKGPEIQVPIHSIVTPKPIKPVPTVASTLHRNLLLQEYSRQPAEFNAEAMNYCSPLTPTPRLNYTPTTPVTSLDLYNRVPLNLTGIQPPYNGGYLINQLSNFNIPRFTHEAAPMMSSGMPRLANAYMTSSGIHKEISRDIYDRVVF